MKGKNFNYTLLLFILILISYLFNLINVNIYNNSSLSIGVIFYSLTYLVTFKMIKKNKIMDVSARDLHVYCNDVVEAMDLALFFLQMRCGVRNIKDINYKLMLVVIAYILLNQSYRNNSRTYDYLEAWYWSSIFSGYFNVDQNINAINSIVNLIESFESNYSADWIKNTLTKNMFKANNFSNKDINSLYSF